MNRNIPAKVQRKDVLGMNLHLECAQEEDGRWLAEVPELPGVLAYGASRFEALSRAEALALRVIADRLEHGESQAMSLEVKLPVAS